MGRSALEERAGALPVSSSSAAAALLSSLDGSVLASAEREVRGALAEVLDTPDRRSLGVSTVRQRSVDRTSAERYDAREDGASRAPTPTASGAPSPVRARARSQDAPRDVASRGAWRADRDGRLSVDGSETSSVADVQYRVRGLLQELRQAPGSH